MSVSNESLETTEVSLEDPPEEINPTPLDKMLVETARHWSKYLEVDTSKHDTAIQYLSDDLMIRLEEFDQLLNMSKDETGVCFFKQMPAIQEKYQEMQPVFENIDNLKAMVDRIKSDMNKLDKELTEAEATVESAPIHSLMPSIIGGAKTFIGQSAASALIRNVISDSGPSSSITSKNSTLSYQPIDIFHTEDFFDDSSEN